MGTLGPNSGGTFVTDSILGVVDWTSAINAQFSDNVYATSGLLLGQISRYLKATNFSFSIPSDATITGITVNIEKSTNTLNGTHDNSVKIVKGGVISGNEMAAVGEWTTSDAVTIYGSSINLWGLTWTPSDINSSTFGVVISAIADTIATAQVDAITITVDYTGSNKPGSTIRKVSVGNGLNSNEQAN